MLTNIINGSEYNLELSNTWGTIRGIIRSEFSFANIKDIVGAAGLPIHELAHLQQSFHGGTSKGQLMDAIEELFFNLSQTEKNRVVSYCIEEILNRKSSLKEDLEQVLERVGWGISGNEPYPLDLQMDIDTSELPEEMHNEVKKVLKRFRDGDITGAMTSICGAVDSLTEDVYQTYDLGDHRDASYQERVAKSIDVFEVEYKRTLEETNLSDRQINIFWQNHRGSVNQAGYVLGACRREFSDVHGEQNSSSIFVKRALDCAVFIIRTIISLM